MEDIGETGVGTRVAVGIIAPVVVQMADIHIPATLGYPLLFGCAFLAVLGFWLVIVPGQPPESVKRVARPVRARREFSIQTNIQTIFVILLPIIGLIIWIIRTLILRWPL